MHGESLQPRKGTGTMDPPYNRSNTKTHFAPMIIEKWALTMFKNAGFTPASMECAARAGIECAC
eukprot:889500-Pelagomonas_calceolata.AAC.1